MDGEGAPAPVPGRPPGARHPPPRPVPAGVAGPPAPRPLRPWRPAAGTTVGYLEIPVSSLIALAAAFAFGLSGVASKRGLAYLEPLTGTLVTVGTCLAGYLLTAPLWMRAGDWFTAGFWLFACVGILQPTLSMYFANEAFSRAGAVVAATFAATSPLFAAGFALLLLDERLTLAIATGTILSVFGIATLSWMPRGGRRLVAAALVFATGTALIRGLNTAVAKFGIDLLPNVFMAGFCSFAVSFAILVAVHRWRRGGWPRRLPRRGVCCFAAAGLCIGCGIGLIFWALLLGRVVVVAPIAGAYPVFTMLAAAALGDERITARVAAGVVLVVAGVALVGVSAG